METKQFSPAVLASISSGVLLCDFSKLHEASEWIMGHPIWTHQFPSLRADLEAAVAAQFPDMPRDIEGVDRDNWQDHAKALEDRFGKTVSVRKGSGLTQLLPTDGLPENANVIVIEK